MAEHRKVPRIAQQRPQIGLETSRPIPSPLQLGQPRAEAKPYNPFDPTPPEELISDLAMEIYSKLAIDHIQRSQSIDQHLLATLAQSAQTAALTYFTTLGHEFEDDQTNG